MPTSLLQFLTAHCRPQNPPHRCTTRTPPQPRRVPPRKKEHHRHLHESGKSCSRCLPASGALCRRRPRHRSEGSLNAFFVALLQQGRFSQRHHHCSSEGRRRHLRRSSEGHHLCRSSLPSLSL
ncbi:hypothetical protein S245_057243 [Arachis hypogaea]